MRSNIEEIGKVRITRCLKTRSGGRTTIWRKGKIVEAPFPSAILNELKSGADTVEPIEWRSSAAPSPAPEPVDRSGTGSDNESMDWETLWNKAKFMNDENKFSELMAQCRDRLSSCPDNIREFLLKKGQKLFGDDYRLAGGVTDDDQG